MPELPLRVDDDLKRSYLVSQDASDARALFTSDLSCYLYHGDCLDLLRRLPDESVHAVVTSPPYNIGKAYEDAMELDDYIAFQEAVVRECVRLLDRRGSLCWQVGNHVPQQGEILPVDILLHGVFASLNLKLRNRIVWHFEHGLHCKRRFSGRYEVIMWYTRSDDYHFDLDPVRVPQKYPGKRHFKGPRAGQLSGHPLGKNPSDVWIFPNVKCNHREKTAHPCQFPIELVDRLLLALTPPGGMLLDPFAGVSSALCAAVLRGRKACGAEINAEYVAISEERIRKALAGTLPVRSSTTPVYEPNGERIAQLPLEFERARRKPSGS